MGVNLALSMHPATFIFEMDSLQLLKILHNSTQTPDWAVLPLVNHIKDLAVDLSSHSWVWTSRLANKAADRLALLVRQRKCPADWCQFPPSCLSHILISDIATFMS